MRLYGIIAGAIVLAFGVGWIYGASGKSDLELKGRSAIERAETTEIRTRILDGRVSLYQMNFGEATKHFAEAAASVERMQAVLREQGSADRVARLDVVLNHIREAQRLAVSLDQNAQNAAAEALKNLNQ